MLNLTPTLLLANMVSIRLGEKGVRDKGKNFLCLCACAVLGKRVNHMYVKDGDPFEL